MTRAQMAALLLGSVFLVVGILGTERPRCACLRLRAGAVWFGTVGTGRRTEARPANPRNLGEPAAVDDPSNLPTDIDRLLALLAASH
jgi:hypothetical protein